MNQSLLKEGIGECLGTFILVLFGCGAVASAVLFQAFSSLLEVAMIWGAGVTVAIFTVRSMSPAHLNPAVTLAMWGIGKIEFSKIPLYITSQLIGAIGAALMIYFIFNNAIIQYEANNYIVRGSIESINTAMMFGEFFPNPEFQQYVTVTWLQALLLEGLGTFLLIMVIFKVAEKQDQPDNASPLIIGLSITLIICFVAPFTQAGLNPARDFGPRIVAFLAGWNQAAFPNQSFLQSFVYIIGPFIGSGMAVLTSKLFTLSHR